MSAEKLIEATRKTIRKMKTFRPTTLDGAVHIWIEEIESALAAHESERTGWQPIETAPKDGTHIILRVKLTFNKFGGFAPLPAYWHSDDLGWLTYNHDAAMARCWEGQNDPTHWMPLPAPPEQTP